MRLSTSLFLGLFLFGSTCSAAFAPGTQSLHYFENNLADELGLRPCTNGSAAVSFQTSPTPPQGAYWVGRFDATHYLDNTLTAAAMASAGFWAVEFYINLSTTADSDVAISTPTQWFDFMSGKLTWVQSGQPNLVTSGTLVASTTYLVDITWNGTTRKIYIDNAERASSATTGTWDVAGTNLKIGELYVPGIGAACNCLLDKVRFMKFTSADQVPTSFPISDASNNIRSSYLKNVVRPYLGRVK